MHRNVTVTGTYSCSYYSIAAPTTELVGPALGGGTCDVCLQLTLLHAREGIVNDGGLQTLGWDVVPLRAISRSLAPLQTCLHSKHAHLLICTHSQITHHLHSITSTSNM